jgi:hypothetical protein
MTTTDQVQLDPDQDTEQLPNYRAVSALAVIAAILGAVSALAILTPALWILPLASLILAVVALRRIATADPPLIGRKAALWGLFLGVFWGVAGLTTHFTQQWIVRTQAQAVAQQWFQYMLQGHTPHAHQLTLYPNRRDFRLDQLDTVYATTPALEERLEAFLQDPGPSAVLRFDPSSEIHYIATEEQYRNADNEYVLMVYELADPGVAKTVQRFVIELRHQPGEEGGWIVQEVLPYTQYEQILKAAGKRR